MISESSPSHDSETLFAEFIKTLMASDNPDLVIADFTERFPQHRDELRELAQLNRELDVERKPVLPPPERLGEFRICRLMAWEKSMRRITKDWTDGWLSRSFDEDGHPLKRARDLCASSKCWPSSITQT
jgi:hypothetical protein